MIGQIEICKTKTITVKEKVNVKSVKFISPSPALNNANCAACQKSIGEARPIAVAWVWTNGIQRSMRVCHDCCKHLLAEKK